MAEHEAVLRSPVRSATVPNEDSCFRSDAMQFETLNCNSCGAPLSVPDAANYVTCNHCSAQLAVRRTESTTFTEQLDQIESKQDKLLEKLSSLEHQHELAQVDRQWQLERESYLVANDRGHRRGTQSGGSDRGWHCRGRLWRFLDDHCCQ